MDILIFYSYSREELRKCLLTLHTSSAKIKGANE